MATIIIIVVFGIAMATLSNIMQNILQRNTKSIQAKLNEVVYLYQHKVIKLPYKVIDDDWAIYISKGKGTNLNEVALEVTSKKTNKTITRKIVSYEEN